MAPKITSQAIVQAVTEQVYLYNVKAIDLNNDKLSYELVLKPQGMGISPNGTVYWQPSVEQVGSQRVVVRVSDGNGGIDLQTFDVVVKQGNSAPIITSLLPKINPQEGKEFKYQVTARDLDGDTLSYALLSSPYQPVGVSIDATTGVVKWTPTAAQIGGVSVSGDFNELVAPWQVTVKVTDGKGGEAYQSLDLIVDALKVNQAPEITSTPRTQTGSGQVYVYQIAASDADGDKLIYTLTNPPAGMVIDTKGLITWTPTAAQSGVKNVAITVSDGTLTTQQTYALTVGNTPINHSPEITSTPTFTTNLDKTYSYQLTGKDIDNDTLIWSLDNAPKGMVIDAQTGIVKWKPTSTQLGTHTVAVRLTDAYGLYVGQEYTLKVNGVNTPPQIQSSPNTVGGLNSPYKYQVKAVDLEGDTLTYTLSRRPNGMVINRDTGLITWTPNATQIGTQTIDVQVTDIQGAVSTQTYNLVVGSSPDFSR